MAVASIMLGCAITIKTEYYKLVYTDQASWLQALTAAAADLRLVPNSLRKLEPPA